MVVQVSLRHPVDERSAIGAPGLSSYRPSPAPGIFPGCPQRRIASANKRTTGRDSGRLVVFASSNSAARAGVIVCTLLRTKSLSQARCRSSASYTADDHDRTHPGPAPGARSGSTWASRHIRLRSAAQTVATRTHALGAYSHAALSSPVARITLVKTLCGPGECRCDSPSTSGECSPNSNRPSPKKTPDSSSSSPPRLPRPHRLQPAACVASCDCSHAAAPDASHRAGDRHTMPASTRHHRHRKELITMLVILGGLLAGGAGAITGLLIAYNTSGARSTPRRSSGNPWRRSPPSACSAPVWHWGSPSASGSGSSSACTRTATLHTTGSQHTPASTQPATTPGTRRPANKPPSRSSSDR
jgi:hypothetical protein